ncbi:MAG: hypothetical protein K8U57_02255 [Planctomycetes bacterium]|nr:hypothetical protein [Planctomycetota bacterium]
MIASFDGSPARGRRLVSIFDSVSADTRLSLDDLEVLMEADTQRRVIAVLNRVFAATHEPQHPEPAPS